MIDIRDFSYRYQGGDDFVLRDINLQVAPGEFVLLTGPSGCGKTTLALGLSGFLFSQYKGEWSGSVEVAGLDIHEHPIYNVADKVGLVQQNPENQFCTLTVEDEIVFGLENRKFPRHKMERLLDWSLDVVGGKDLHGRQLSELSGGEKQKVALAAVLAGRPQLIIFDEPTSNLDPPSTQEIFEVILDMQREMELTVVVIEHKLDFLSRIHPRVIEMGMGTIVNADRSHDHLPPLELEPPRLGDQNLEPVLEVKGLSAGYGDKTVLDDISFSVTAGEWITFLGDNGSGKSTLLLCLLRMVENTRGEIRIKGKDLEQISTSRIGKEMGLVFQNPDHQIFASTVWEEAVFGPQNFELERGSYQERTLGLLEKAGLEDREEDAPFRLSYGQKRRLNLISILAYRPDVLLLDELFIGQDRDSARFLLELLCDYVADGGSVIMVNHNPSYYPFVATRLWFLSAGKLVIDASLKTGMEELGRMGKMVYLPGGNS